MWKKIQYGKCYSVEITKIMERVLLVRDTEKP